MNPSKRSRVAGVSPLDREGHNEKAPRLGGIRLEAEVVVNRPPQDCYQQWHDFEKLPRFLSHVESVVMLDAKRSRWSLAGPADSYLEWEAELLADIPGERISWRSLPGSQVENAGSVHFRPRESGAATELDVSLSYNPPGGIFGEWVARLFGENPQRELEEDLETFRRVMEGASLDVEAPTAPHPESRPDVR